MNTIYEECLKVAREIEGNFGGGSPVPKTFIMSYLIQEQKLKSFVEVGVYRGRSLFPVAYSIYLNGGNSVGIDPYELSDAKEEDVSDDLKIKIDTFLESLDFNDLYRDVLAYRESCGYGKSIDLVRDTSKNAFLKFKAEDQKFDIAHIDGNHDTKFVREDYANCYESLVEGGFIVFDDIDWPSVRKVYDEAKKTSPVVFETALFGILIKEQKSIKRELKIEKLTKKLHEVYGHTESIIGLPEDYIPTVAVGVLTYNQAPYIEECLDSVFSQTGNFNLHVVICDDSSTDGTSEMIYNYIAGVTQNEELRVTYVRNEKNIGVIPNLKKLISLLGNSDYFTFCEGDDYYLSGTRISQHIKLQEKNPQFGMTYNRLLSYQEDTSAYRVFEPGYVNNILPTEELVKENVIGNLNCAFYSSRLLTYVKSDLFSMFAGDWMLAIYLSQFASVGLLNKPLNVYRVHDGGIWTRMASRDQRDMLLGEMDKYNKYLHFIYDEFFSYPRKRMIRESGESYDESINLAIIDDISPHPISGFRYQEFTTIMNEIRGSKLYTTGESVHVLGKDRIEDLIVDFKRSHSSLVKSVDILASDTKFKADLIYGVFLGNAFANIAERAEITSTPFVFTLYPGGMFALNNQRSDDMLERVLSSPQFRKVIVTQNITYDYLIEKNYCNADKIEYIFGVVVPLEKLNIIIEKKHFGIDKDTLDICFVAHKYTEFGQDKGYDVFVEVAKRLSKKHDNIRFHVVGPWDENVLSTKGIKHITFYGTQGQDWFDNFYKGIDIILSPNTNGKIFNGSFDGFPTGAVTDASLRGVAMFVTDPLKQNHGRFKVGEEIVIIDRDVRDIENKILNYYNHPKSLVSLAKKGYKKTNKVYSYEAQIAPRIKILNKELEIIKKTKAATVPVANEALEEQVEVVHRDSFTKRFYHKIVPFRVRKMKFKLKRFFQKLRQV